MRGWAFLLLAMLAGPVAAHDLPACNGSDFQTLRQVGGDEYKRHGGEVIAPITEAFNSVKPYDFWIDYVIDETGHVACISTANIDESTLTLTPERQAVLDSLAKSSFTPFTDGAHAERVWAEQYVTELERPQAHVPRPQGDLASVKIQLENHGHRSPDNGFMLIVAGDGTVTYTLDDGSPDPLFGTQTYHISPDQVSAMLDIAENADYWSLRDTYRSYYPGDKLADKYYNRVAITIGGQNKDLRIYDSAGVRGTGISEDTYELMYKLAGIAKIRLWQDLSVDTIAQLEEDNFDFTSDRGGNILLQATADDRFSDSAIADIISRGAPADYTTSDYFVLETGLLDAAIAGHRAAMVEDLVAKGALLSDGKTDPHKLSRALARAAADVEPGMVTKFLAYHPDLVLRTTSDDNGQTVVHTDPIITLVGEEAGLSPRFGWGATLPDLISVTQQLLDAGADINSLGSGQSLVAKAVADGNTPFVQWLISKGAVLDKSVWIAYHDEDTTVFLLENSAQIDAETMTGIIDNAARNRETKVIAWLKAHGKWPADEQP